MHHATDQKHNIDNKMQEIRVKTTVKIQGSGKNKIDTI